MVQVRGHGQHAEAQGVFLERHRVCLEFAASLLFHVLHLERVHQECSKSAGVFGGPPLSIVARMIPAAPSLITES